MVNFEFLLMGNKVHLLLCFARHPEKIVCITPTLAPTHSSQHELGHPTPMRFGVGRMVEMGLKVKGKSGLDKKKKKTEPLDNQILIDLAGERRTS